MAAIRQQDRQAGATLNHEVEFVGYDGHTVALVTLVTLERSQVRPLEANDIPHVRTVATA